jgi:hypothetical protein
MIDENFNPGAGVEIEVGLNRGGQDLAKCVIDVGGGGFQEFPE